MVSAIWKNKEDIEGADTAKGVMMFNSQRTQVPEEMEKLPLVRLNEKELAGDSIRGAIICEKARTLHSDLQ